MNQERTLAHALVNCALEWNTEPVRDKVSGFRCRCRNCGEEIITWTVALSRIKHNPECEVLTAFKIIGHDAASIAAMIKS